MALYLHTNLSALQTQRTLGTVTRTLDTTYERLSSGLRINTAKDDPAGIQTSDRMTRELNSLSETNRIAQNGISYSQTAEGALDEITSMLQTIRTLAIQAANGTKTSSDRRAIQEEVDQLNAEIVRIADKTTFAGEEILSGTASVARFQISPAPNSVIKIDMRRGFQTDSLAKLAGDYKNNAYGTGSTATFTVTDDDNVVHEYKFVDIFSYKVNGKGIDLTTYSKAQTVLGGIDYLINAVDSKRAELGAIQNRLESTIRNQSNISANVSESRSRIRDTDYAEEVTNLTTAQIIQQGAASILTQANSRPEIALSILNGE
ncbi:MAG: flagellin [Succinivibrio sp.]|nr:flagellin [Succinivibrio sp.]